MKLFARIALALALAASLPCTAQPRPQQPDMTIDAATRSAVVDALADSMDRHYVSPDTARRVGQQLRAALAGGAYEQMASARQFAKALSDTIRAAADDRHLRVRYSRQPLPAEAAAPAPAQAEAELARAFQRDSGVVSVERLEGNIGYLRIDEFAPARFAADTFAAAMTLLQGTDALVIDLRATRGGEPDGVALLESYFFDKPTHMNSVYERRGNVTREYWTSKTVKGPHYGSTRPVYVLTSANTFSGGEDLAYSMRVQKRATLVGATTGGGANPGEMHRLHDHFEAFISDGRAINPVTKTNWEGVGVTPDIEVAPGDALRQARMLALRQLAGAAGDPRERAALEALLQKAAGTAE